MCINIYVCIYSLAAVLLGFIDYCRLVTDNMWKNIYFFFKYFINTRLPNKQQLLDRELSKCDQHEFLMTCTMVIQFDL